MNEEKIKVLYVAGSGRSGSTVLGNLLGEIYGFFSAGELCYLWARLMRGGACSCGASFPECEVWGPVLEEAFGSAQGVDVRAMHRVQRMSTRPRHIPLMLAPQGRRRLESVWERGYAKNLERIYRAMRSVTGDSVIVDSSKLPLYGYVLEGMPRVDLYVVHLVRDPRAVAYSWSRKKKSRPLTESLTFMPQHHPAQSSLEWDLCNAATEALWCRSPERYMRLRYEEFVARPRESVERILQLVGEESASLPFVGDREVRLGPNHNVGGNPSRFETGTVELRPDREWTFQMRPRARATVTSLTLPLLGRYGYPRSPAAGG